MEMDIVQHVDLKELKEKISIELDISRNINKYISQLRGLDEEDFDDICVFLLEYAGGITDIGFIHNLQELDIPNDLILEEIVRYLISIPQKKIDRIIAYDLGFLNAFENFDIKIDGLHLGDYLLKYSYQLAFVFIKKGAIVSEYQKLINLSILNTDMRIFRYALEKWDKKLSTQISHPLYVAISTYNYDMIPILLNSISPNLPTSSSPNLISPIEGAISIGDITVIKDLILRGVSLKHLKLSDTSTLSIVELLLENGYNSTYEDLECMYHTNIEVASKLLNTGIKTGNSAIVEKLLRRSIIWSRSPWIKLLLKYVPITDEIAYILYQKGLYNLVPTETCNLAQWEVYAMKGIAHDKLRSIAKEAGIPNYHTLTMGNICYALRNQMENISKLTVKYADRKSYHNYESGTLSGSNLEDIPPSYLISIMEDNKLYCFEVADIPILLKDRVNPYTRQSLSHQSIISLTKRLNEFKEKGISLSFPDLRSIHMKLPRNIRKGSNIVDDIDNLVCQLQEKGLQKEYIRDILSLERNLIQYIEKTEFIFEYKGVYKFSPSDIQRILSQPKNVHTRVREILHILNEANLLQK